MPTAERAEPSGRTLRLSSELLSRPAVGRVAAALVVVAVSILSLALRRLVPHQLNTSGLDGLLYAEQVVSLDAGDWLGPYDLVTLAKVPGYPLFVAATGRVGMQVKDAEQLVALTAALLAGVCVLVLGRRLVPAVAAFVVCALDPVLFSSLAADFLRDGLFASLSVVVVCSLFLAGHLLAARPAPWWGLLAAVLAGLPLSGLLLLREEGLVVVPTVLVALLAPLAPGLLRALRRGGLRRADEARQLVRPVVAVLAAGVLVGTTAAVPSLLVQQRNDDVYGVALTNDWVEGSFLEA